jgi:hypothetical protein
MAIILPSGFNITNNEPVDARFSLADQTARYGLSSANIYEGLVVYQRDNDTLWILVDTTQVSGPGGWQQITSSELSDTITDRLDSLELTSASHDDRLDQLEADSGSQSGRLDNLEGFTSSIDTIIKTKLNIETVVSGSSQIILQDTTGLLSASRIDGFVSSATNATYADNTIVYGKNLHTTTIPKGTPLYFTNSGTNGNIVGVLPADAGNPSLMPAGGIAGESILVDEEGIILLDGFISEVNTTAFTSGDEVFVAVGGGYTNVPPTGSNNLIQFLGYVEKSAINGSGVIQMSGEVRGVPNIQEGYTWVGNLNGVATPSTTQSVVEHIFTQDNSFSGTQTFSNIVVNGTGSFAFIQSTTGSSTSIGEAFIILNENTPSSNFAGIKVVDSGSSFTTASFVYDGLNNNWVFQHEGSVDSGSSLAIFGPLSQGGLGTEVGLTENRIPKSVTNHGHHIGDSNITDSGTLITLNSNSQVNGNLVVNGSVSANNLISGSSQISYPDLSNIPAGIVSGSSQVTPLLPSGVVSGSSQIDLTATTNYVSGIKTRLDAEGVVSGSTQITKTLQDVTTAGNTTSTSISITNSTASTSKTTGALIVTGGIGTSGDVFAGGDVVAYASSDRRLKDNIQPIQNPLQKINQIGGYSFEWNQEAQDIYRGKDYGVIAQEIEEILPELVDTRENGYKAVKYDKLVSLLIEGIKDLSKQVEELKKK